MRRYLPQLLAAHADATVPRLVRIILWTEADYEAFESALSHDRWFGSPADDDV